MLTSLLGAARPGVLHLVLIGRTGTPWPAGWEPIPSVVVPPLSLAESEQMADHLFAGLSTPSTVRQRFLAAAGGCPFFLEEGIATLIHRKQVRRVYGSFFFSGDDDTPFIPSPRLVAHVEAEIRRLGPSTPLRLLALAGGAAPVAELRSAAALIDPRDDAAPPDWAVPYLATGLLLDADSPWGAGVEFAHPAVGIALASTVGSRRRDGGAPNPRRAGRRQLSRTPGLAGTAIACSPARPRGPTSCCSWHPRWWPPGASAASRRRWPTATCSAPSTAS